MSKFDDDFLEVQKFWAEGELVISRISYSREEAATQINLYHREDYWVDPPDDPDIGPDDLTEGWVRFRGGYTDDGDWVNTWWFCKESKGAKPVWVWDPYAIMIRKQRAQLAETQP